MSYAAAIAAETAETTAANDAALDALRARAHERVCMSEIRSKRAADLWRNRAADRALMASCGLDRFGRTLAA